MSARGGRWFDVLTYDAQAIPLDGVVAEMLGVDDLTGITCDPITCQEDDQKTVFHQRYYENVDLLFEPYAALLAALSLNDSQLLVQHVPTLRVQTPGSLAVGRWHDDAEYGHHRAETNYWVPLTSVCADNTLWIVDEPVLVDVGEVVRFNGATVRHGNVVNRSCRSRVSIDFRTVHPARYSPGGRSVSHGVEFEVGKYWRYSGTEVTDRA